MKKFTNNISKNLLMLGLLIGLLFNSVDNINKETATESQPEPFPTNLSS
ncbi:hypothetical protein [Cytobacillus sp. IB215316]|nr:hypothetical protein [Cytobacillus sp. IB215316]MDX8361507.1 hypothetical protein [Cytobacillus sp. IB215316]